MISRIGSQHGMPRGYRVDYPNRFPDQPDRFLVPAPQWSRAFSLTEVAVILLIAALLFSMVPSAFMHMVDTVESNNAAQELQKISDQINEFRAHTGHYPDSLDEVMSPVPLDPWGHPYQYLRIDGGSPSGIGKERKDKYLVPINSDYDLYSMGPDGKSVPPLTASASHDDIVRGRNGKFFGLATDY